ncbi:MAG: 1-acyl-sn-glycerol-3-phosphate acyltransferase [Acidimicrobiia bacterium]
MKGIRSAIAYALSLLVTNGLFRSFEIDGQSPHDGPRLIVANHFNGLVDAIVLVRGLHGLPHFIAKSTLFKRLPLRLALRALGVVPVYRQSDVSDRSGNTSSFEEVRAALAKGRTVLIFPEGTVTDEQRLQRIRTGAARIALGAAAEGVRGLLIVPMGITYEDKVASRSRVLVQVGEPIPVDDEVAALAHGAEISEDNHDLVRSTTDLIRERLLAVSPDYGSLVRERSMMRAAGVYARSHSGAFDEPSVSAIRAVAQRLADATGGAGDRAIDAVGRYELALSAVGLRDDQINPPPRVSDLARVVVTKTIVVIIILPFALFGLLVNLVPIVLTWLVGAAIREPVTKGTARVLTALVMFPLAWTIQILAVDPDYTLLTLVLMIVSAVLLVVGFKQVLDLIEATITYTSVRTRRALLDDLAALREQADGAIEAALAESGAAA